MADLRIRKDSTQIAECRWRVEIQSNPPSDGMATGHPSWVDAMVEAGRLLRDIDAFRKVSQ